MAAGGGAYNKRPAKVDRCDADELVYSLAEVEPKDNFFPAKNRKQFF